MRPIALLIFLHAIHAGAQQYNFRNYSVKEGVAQSQVYALLQDSRGYLWMGTRGGGITCFDGYRFTTYTKKQGLSSNYIYCIKENKDGKLLIGTNNGLSVYNGVKFENFGVRTGDTSQFSVLDIALGFSGELWLATNQGVYTLDKGLLKNISSLCSEKPMMINTILSGKSGEIWYGTVQGLCKITVKNSTYSNNRLYKKASMSTGSVNTIKLDLQGRLWMGTYNNGLFVLNKDSAKRIEDPQLNVQSVFDLYFDENGNVWIATLNKGIGLYNALAKTLQWIGENEGLSNNHVRCIARDKSGNFWFGTSGGGVCNYFGNRFTTYDKSSGLPGNFIYSLYKDSRNRLVIGNSDKGFSLLDSGRFHSYGQAQGFGDFKVKAISEDSKGRLLIGTEANGLYLFDQDTFIPIRTLEKKYIRAILNDQNGHIYVATAGTGIYILNASNPDSGHVQLQAINGLLSNRISSLHLDKTGKVWYGTENNGFSWIENKQASGSAFTISDGMPSNSIRCMTEDANGQLWIGTAGNGIAVMPLYQGKSGIQSFDYKDGLTSSNIYLLQFDEKNRLFAGSETGLDLIEFDKNNHIVQVKHFSKGEGFTGIETCQNSVCKESNGTIWFGTINGLIRYISTEKFKNLNEPVLNITNVKLFYEPLYKAGLSKFIGDWNTVKSLDLPYSKNHLTFDFLGINFNNPEAVSYRWKLEGFDQDWSPPSKQNTVTYSNLPFGNYVFNVISCNEEGIWNKTPKRIWISIHPPFWRKPWVMIFSGLLISGMILLAFRWRINSIRKKAAETEEKLKLEKELIELEQKALRLQMNPHFIFNALNSIQSQIGTDNEQTARYYLAKFSRLMRQILDNSRSSTITLEEEINTLENYLLIEKFCNGDRFDYEIAVQDNLETDFIQIPPMLLQPFIENAIKHGLKDISNRKGFIKVEIKEQDNLLICSVEDNGIGREESEKQKKHSKETYHKSTALKVTRERLEVYRSKLNAEPLEIIDLKDDKGQATGTKVEIRIPLL